ncbi:hypothetical protein J2Y48_003124 [Mycoplana sp. BE70]|uniref:hypothetical protein n=1 Tax=Mycoplana sp. BE70 TaxID=2817775 RepID=UPI00285CF8E9|nr:hypothetical protein [Mycoplana sp. BE70]MDR6757827.1 hypothetical protein [Mycoplana sp. BE70]
MLWVMVNNVYKFRRVKWGNPREKLKVLSEDIQRRVWLDRLSPVSFWSLAAAVWTVIFTSVIAILVYVVP